MSDKTHIGWTDATWTPVTGCTRVSEGCRNCYAERLTATRIAANPKYAGLATLTPNGPRWANEVRLNPSELDKPLRWKKPRRIFVNSMSDTFHEKVPFEFIDEIWAAMALCPQHTFQVLTKRPERMVEYLRHGHRYGRSEHFGCFEGPVAEWPLPNVWLGTSCEDQSAAGWRIQHLLECPAAVHFVSCEPLLGALSLTEVEFGSPIPGGQACANKNVLQRLFSECEDRSEPKAGAKVDWVIVGGESGPNARPMSDGWAYALVKQCERVGTACFFKQAGSVLARTWGCKSPSGADPSEWPERFRVQQFAETILAKNSMGARPHK